MSLQFTTVFSNTCTALRSGFTTLHSAVQIENPWKTILSRKYRPQLVLAAASTFFQQWTGINTIIFYGKAGMQA